MISTIGRDLYQDFSGGQNWELFPDVIPTLEKLKSSQVILGVVSNFDERLRELNKICEFDITFHLDRILKCLDIEKYFTFVLAAYEVSCAKPDVK